MAAVTLHAEVLRELYTRVLAKTLTLTRKLSDAEDAVQDALERALKSWPETGAPESPEAWLVTVAANAYRDRLRRVRREELEPDALETLAQMSPWARVALVEPEVARAWKDELLRPLYPYVHLVRGTLLAELGQHVEARSALARAEEQARNAAERAQIHRQLEQLTATQREKR